MARKIWQGDFVWLWFGRRPHRQGERSSPPRVPNDAKADDHPLGIVERNRLARQEKWALKLDQ